jgi:hypothetical protein
MGLLAIGRADTPRGRAVEPDVGPHEMKLAVGFPAQVASATAETIDRCKTRCPPRRRSAGRTNSSKLTIAETGFPGSPKTGVAESPKTPKASGFAGLMATCIQRIFPAHSFSSTTRTRSRSPTLTPPLVMMASQRDAAEDNDSTRADSSSPTDPEVDALPPLAPEECQEGVTVGVADPAGGERARSGEQLVAGGEHADPRPAVHPHPEGALIGDDAQVGRTKCGSGYGDDVPDGHVAAGLADERTRLQRTSDHDVAAVGFRFGLFDHADRVSSGRKGGAGHDARRLARPDGLLEEVAGHDRADHRKTDGSPRCVVGPHCIAVH